MEVGNLAVVAFVLRTTIKKGRQLFQEKVHSQRKWANPGYADE